MNTALRFALDFDEAAAPAGQALAIRPALPADHAAVCEVLVAAFRQYRSVLPARAFMTYLTEVLDLETELQGGQVLVAERNGRVMGTMTCAAGGTPGARAWPRGWQTLGGLAVLPERRGLGTAAALFEEGFARARLRGATALGVHLLPPMRAAIDLVESFGLRRSPAFDLDLDSATPMAPRDHLPRQAYVIKLR